jgi:hypothetical protein
MYTEIILLVVSLVLIVLNVYRNQQPCPPTKVVYQYIPRSFTDEQSNPARSSQLFSGMFTNAPFTNGFIQSDPTASTLSGTNPIFSDTATQLGSIGIRQLYGTTGTVKPATTTS